MPLYLGQLSIDEVWKTMASTSASPTLDDAIVKHVPYNSSEGPSEIEQTAH